MNKEIQNAIDAIMDKASSWETKLRLANNLAEKYGTTATTDLCRLLDHNDGEVRNAAALALREIKDSSAVAALMRAIKNPKNIEDRSTLVYALSAMECSRYFRDIVDLTLSRKADVMWAACDVLFEQGFYVNNEAVQEAIRSVTAAEIDPDLKNDLIERLTDFLTEGGSDRADG